MSILFTDNFVRADSADFGTNWDENTADANPGGFNIASNTGVPVSVTADSSETVNAISAPNDQYAEVTFGTTAADGAGAGSGVVCRSAAAAVTFYRAVGNASGYGLSRFVAGGFTSLSSGTGTTFTAADKLRLEVRTNGANADWILKKNGSTFASGTDTSPIASGRVGVAHSSNSSAGAGKIAAFEAGDFVVPPFIPIVGEGPAMALAGDGGGLIS